MAVARQTRSSTLLLKQSITKVYTFEYQYFLSGGLSLPYVVAATGSDQPKNEGIVQTGLFRQLPLQWFAGQLSRRNRQPTAWDVTM